MARLALDDYPERYALVNELHARPFPELTAPCSAVHIALMPEGDAADRERDRAHLVALLDRYGAPHPAPDASHYSGTLGRGFLKWEMHTEFVTYTLFTDGVDPRPFSGAAFELFPADWLAEAPGKVLTSCLVRIDTAGPEAFEAVAEGLRRVVRAGEPDGQQGGGRRGDGGGGLPHRRARARADFRAGAAGHRAAAAGADRAAAPGDRYLQVHGDAGAAPGAVGVGRGGADRPGADRGGGGDGGGDRARGGDAGPAA